MEDSDLTPKVMGTNVHVGGRGERKPGHCHERQENINTSSIQTRIFHLKGSKSTKDTSDTVIIFSHFNYATRRVRAEFVT